MATVGFGVEFSLDPSIVVGEIIELVAGIPAKALQVAADQITENLPDFNAIAAKTREAISGNREPYLEAASLLEVDESDGVDSARVSRKARDQAKKRFTRQVEIDGPVELATAPAAQRLSKEEVALRRTVDRVLKLSQSGKFAEADLPSIAQSGGPQSVSAGLATRKPAQPKDKLALRRAVADLEERAKAAGADEKAILAIVEELSAGVSPEGVAPSLAADKPSKIVIEQIDAEAAIQNIVRLVAEAAGESVDKLPEVVGADIADPRIEDGKFLVPQKTIGQVQLGNLDKGTFDDLADVARRDVIAPIRQGKVAAKNLERLQSRKIDSTKAIGRIVQDVLEQAEYAINKLPEVVQVDGDRVNFDGERLLVPPALVERIREGLIEAADVESIARALDVVADPGQGLVTEELLTEFSGKGTIKPPRVVAAEVDRPEFSKDKLDLRVPKTTLERIEQGNLTSEDVEGIAKAVRAISGKKDEKLRLTAQESTKYARVIEQKAAEGRGAAAKRSIRSEEADSTAFASRVAPAVRERVLKKAAISQFEDSVGLGGAGAGIAAGEEAETAFSQLQRVAEEFAVGLQDEIQESQSKISASTQRVQAAIEDAQSIEILPADSILALQDAIVRQVAAAKQEIDASLQVFEGIAQAKPQKVREGLESQIKTFGKRDLEPLAERFGVATRSQDKRRSRSEVASEIARTADLRELEPAVREIDDRRQQQRQKKIDTAKAVVSAPVRAERAVANAAQKTADQARSAIDSVGDAILRLRDAIDIEPINRLTDSLGVMALSGAAAYSKLAQAERQFADKFGAAGKAALFVKDNFVAPSLITGAARGLPALGGAIGAGFDAVDNVAGSLVSGGLDAAGFGAAEAFVPKVFAPAESSGGILGQLTAGFDNQIGHLTTSIDNLSGEVSALAKNAVTETIDTTVI
ncbi:MAG: hypothetical protein U5M53_06975 [Rhodoferax sp.]|nr:hypothetical protein [Rhodoferax sp.]